jgi:glutamine amidotransferase
MNNNFVAIIDGGGANFTSIQAALTQCAMPSEVTSHPQRIQEASHVILPGVGAAGYAMKLLNDKGLIAVIRHLTQPVLGICLGQQLLCDYSAEDNTDCLGIIPLQVKRLTNARVIPHMGWNNMDIVNNNDYLLNGITTENDFYFVHSFAPELKSPYAIGICNYGVAFAAVIKKNNFYGVQFHPEKSGIVGMKILQNFIRISRF